MEDFETRVKNARRDYKKMKGTLWDNIDELWEKGYSLRVISETTGLTRSKIQRYISEGNKSRIDDVPTQNRDVRVRQTFNLLKQGLSKKDIAHKLNLNPRTVDSYIKQLKNQGVIE